MINCKDCKHWGKNKYDSWSEQDNIRTCHLIEGDSQSMIIINANDDYGLSCVTHENFGCVLGVQK